MSKEYPYRYRGFVVDNEDPENRCRLKVRVPQVYGDYVPDYWAESVGIPCGSNAGLVLIPQVGDCIWVSFEMGDIDYPVWEYGWFADGDLPESAKNNGKKPTNVVLQAYKGHRIELDNKDNSISIKTKRGLTMKLKESGGISIDGLDQAVDIQAGSAKLKIKDSTISLVAGKIELGGSMNVLYSLVPNAPVITNVAQIGVSKKVTVL